MNMKKAAGLAVLLMIAIFAYVYAQQEASVSLSLSTDKDVYKVDEPVVISLGIASDNIYNEAPGVWSHITLSRYSNGGWEPIKIDNYYNDAFTCTDGKLMNGYWVAGATMPGYFREESRNLTWDQKHLTGEKNKTCGNETYQINIREQVPVGKYKVSFSYSVSKEENEWLPDASWITSNSSVEHEFEINS